MIVATPLRPCLPLVSVVRQSSSPGLMFQALLICSSATEHDLVTARRRVMACGLPCAAESVSPPVHAIFRASHRSGYCFLWVNASFLVCDPALMSGRIRPIWSNGLLALVDQRTALLAGSRRQRFVRPFLPRVPCERIRLGMPCGGHSRVFVLEGSRESFPPDQNACLFARHRSWCFVRGSGTTGRFP